MSIPANVDVNVMDSPDPNQANSPIIGPSQANSPQLNQVANKEINWEHKALEPRKENDSLDELISYNGVTVFKNDILSLKPKEVSNLN